VSDKKNWLGKLALTFSCVSSLLSPAKAETLSVGQKAPEFQLSTHEGALVDLQSRKGQGWTVLYFYPKADTPGCTKQACAFRDSIKVIRDEQAEVYGISTDSVEDLKKFHQKYRLNFTLLSDSDAQVTEAYGVKMPVLTLSKRWTFILDSDLIIRSIDDKVDPALDAQHVAEIIRTLKLAKP